MYNVLSTQSSQYSVSNSLEPRNPETIDRKTVLEKCDADLIKYPLDYLSAITTEVDDDIR